MKVIPVKLTQTFSRSLLKTQKNSPHILFAAGVVGVVAGTVLACRATLKLEDTLDEIKEDVHKVTQKKKDSGKLGARYEDSDYYRDLGLVYGKSVVSVTRLYGPSVIVSGVSIAALTGSHIQMTKRNTALTVTLAAISKAFDEYRIRVQEEIGEERELEIHRGITHEKIEGQKELQTVTDPNSWSIYARMFDEGSRQWQKSPEMNRAFIQCQQNYMNHLLHARGHVFLNEVYDALDLERSTAGSVVGWVINGNGDGYIDFGLFEASSSRFINNFERNIILDFNVDGVIYDKI